MKMLARMEELAPVRPPAPFSFEFASRSARPIHCSCSRSRRRLRRQTVLGSVKLVLRSGERIGSSASTARQDHAHQDDRGYPSRRSPARHSQQGVAIGYFAQHQSRCCATTSRRSGISPACTPVREQAAAATTRSFNISGDMATGPVEHFSRREGAPRARADRLAAADLLLLDEPTNHLDLETREALTARWRSSRHARAVSHDRHLLRASTEQAVVVREAGCRSSTATSTTTGSRS